MLKQDDEADKPNLLAGEPKVISDLQVNSRHAFTVLT